DTVAALAVDLAHSIQQHGVLLAVAAFHLATPGQLADVLQGPTLWRAEPRINGVKQWPGVGKTPLVMATAAVPGTVTRLSGPLRCAGRTTLTRTAGSRKIRHDQDRGDAAARPFHGLVVASHASGRCGLCRRRFAERTGARTR